MKKIALVVGVLLVFCLASTAFAAKTYTLKVSTVLTETDPLFLALTEVFEKQVE